jgi:hypothetical protein
LPDWLHPQSKDFWQVAAWIVAIIGGLIAAFKAIHEMRLSRIQRERELAWSRSKEAAALLDRLLADPLARAAAVMLDWSGRVYALPSGEKVRLERPQVLNALRIRNMRFTPAEGFVRDCFDAFFGHIERMENATEVELVAQHDLKSLGYYAKKMAKNRAVFVTFLKEYDYQKVLAFLDRTPEWINTPETQPGEEDKECSIENG